MNYLEVNGGVMRKHKFMDRIIIIVKIQFYKNFFNINFICLFWLSIKAYFRHWDKVLKT